MQVLDQRYKRKDNFVFRQIENETILVPIKDNVGDMGCIYNLNEVGAFVWQHLDGSKTLLDIKKNILSEFEVSEKQAEEDLSEFIGDLKSISAVFLPDV